MTETAGVPIPPLSAPRKMEPWVIVVVVLVGLCCLCVGATGLLFAFGGPILNELGLLHTQLPALIVSM